MQIIVNVTLIKNGKHLPSLGVFIHGMCKQVFITRKRASFNLFTYTFAITRLHLLKERAIHYLNISDDCMSLFVPYTIK